VRQNQALRQKSCQLVGLQRGAAFGDKRLDIKGCTTLQPYGLMECDAFYRRALPLGRDAHRFAAERRAG